jgi:hypothetical protein
MKISAHSNKVILVAMLVLATTLVCPQKVSALQAAAPPNASQDAVIQRLHYTVLGHCDAAKVEHNITPEECRSLVDARSLRCEPVAKKQLSEAMGDAAKERLAKRYFVDCIMPHYFCNGVEVRSLAEVAGQCRP